MTNSTGTDIHGSLTTARQRLREFARIASRSNMDRYHLDALCGTIALFLKSMGIEEPYKELSIIHDSQKATEAADAAHQETTRKRNVARQKIVPILDYSQPRKGMSA